MNKCAVVIPIYKKELSKFEWTNLKISLQNLIDHDVYIIAPEHLNLAFVLNKLGKIKIKQFDDKSFSSISNYSKLMLSKEFFSLFNDYSHILICQTDAIVIRQDLQHWLDQPYDYIGAPWPNGYELTIKTKHIPLPEGIKCKTYVGNGGLSLRRIVGCTNLMDEFEDIHNEWINHGHAEDLFYGLVGYLSTEFRLPNVITAANFSHETEPDFMYSLIGNKLPFGAHGFDKYPNKNLEKFISDFKLT